MYSAVTPTKVSTISVISPKSPKMSVSFVRNNHYCRLWLIFDFTETFKIETKRCNLVSQRFTIAGSSVATIYHCQSERTRRRLYGRRNYRLLSSGVPEVSNLFCQHTRALCPYKIGVAWFTNTEKLVGEKLTSMPVILRLSLSVP